MLTFEYPYLLWGLLALAAPIILHLLNRSNPNILVFPSVKYLFRAQLPNEGRRRLRDILMLLLRMIALASAVLLIARPKWTPLLQDTQKDTNNIALFLLDRSASMSGWNQLSTEQNQLKQALDEIKSLPGNWQFAAVASSDKIIAEAQPTNDASRIIDFAKETAPTHLAGEHGAALAKAVQLLTNSK